jgi:hypothetical protein
VNRFWTIQQKYFPFWPVVSLVVITFVLLRMSSDVHGWRERATKAEAAMKLADSTVQQMREQDVADSLQREREQFIMDSLGGVIRFQTRTLAQWERAKTTLHPVDTSLAVEVQLSRCQDNEITLRASADALASSLALATEAGNAAIAKATEAKLRADSADARRAVASDSVRVLLAGATKALKRPWYKKLWGGTKQVVTSAGLIGVGVVAGKLF